MAERRKPAKKAAAPPTSIDAYLARLDDEKRAALEKLRSAIRAAAPKAEDCISYRLPAFRLDGRMLVWFGASKNHLSLYPGAGPIRLYADELQAYKTTKGTIQFKALHPLPLTLVKKLVKARTAENRAKGAGR